MKIIFTFILLALSLLSFAQFSKKTETAIRIVNRNFKTYTSAHENSVSWKTKHEMLNALTQLQQTVKDKDLPLLINVWMYYDPTDFPTRDLIAPIFKDHKTAALIAISNRLEHKKEWEAEDKAPYSELIALKKELLKQQH